MMKNKITSKALLEILFLHIVLIIYSICTVFSKKAAGHDFLSFKFCLFYACSIVGLGVYAILWQQVLKRFSLVVAYANKAIVVIWGLVWGYFLFNEQVKLNMIIGSLIIVIGVLIIGAENE